MKNIAIMYFYVTMLTDLLLILYKYIVEVIKTLFETIVMIDIN